MLNAKRKRIDNETSAVESLTVTGTATFADGSVGTPSIAFSLDPDTGLYRIGSNNIGISLGGANVLDLSSSVLRIEVPVDLDNITVNGNLQSDSFTTGDITSDHILVNEQLELDQGTAALPSLTFINDNNTGIYSTADLLAFSTGGTKRFEISTSATTSVLPLAVSSTTDSSSVSTGSIVASGGIGAAKNLVIGGYLRIPTSSVSITGSTTTLGNGDSIARLTGDCPIGGSIVVMPSAAAVLGRKITVYRSTGAGSYGVLLTTDSSSDVFDMTLQQTVIAFLPSSKFNLSFTSMGLDPSTSKYIWGVEAISEYSNSLTATGPIASTSITITYQRKNKSVTIHLPDFSVAGNSTGAAMNIATVPADYRPNAQPQFFIRVKNAGSSTTGLAVISAAGVITIYASATGASFTSSGSDHGFYGTYLTYMSDYKTDV